MIQIGSSTDEEPTLFTRCKSEDLSCFIRGSNFVSVFSDNSCCSLYELSVGFSKYALGIHYVVFHTDSDVSAKCYCGVKDLHSAVAYSEA